MIILIRMNYLSNLVEIYIVVLLISFVFFILFLMKWMRRVVTIALDFPSQCMLLLKLELLLMFGSFKLNLVIKTNIWFSSTLFHLFSHFFTLFSHFHPFFSFFFTFSSHFSTQFSLFSLLCFVRKKLDFRIRSYDLQF